MSLNNSIQQLVGLLQKVEYHKLPNIEVGGYQSPDKSFLRTVRDIVADAAR